MSNLSVKTALVTGASRGIGRAIGLPAYTRLQAQVGAIPDFLTLYTTVEIPSLPTLLQESIERAEEIGHGGRV